jgi:NitT/TauT family transport system permease protein
LKSHRKTVFFLIDIVVILILWTVISHSSEVAYRFVLPPVGVVFSDLKELIKEGILIEHVKSSLQRTLIGFCLACMTALPIGLLLGWSKRLYLIFDPIIEIIRPISPIAWIPLSILWFGIGEGGKIFIIWLIGFFFIIINTINGVRTINVNLIEAAKTLGASTKFIFLKVVIPAAIPNIMTGLRLGMGVSIGAVIIAEMIAARSGIGFMMERARTIINPSPVIVGFILIGLIGFCVNLIFIKIEDRLMKHRVSIKDQR